MIDEAKSLDPADRVYRFIMDKNVTHQDNMPSPVQFPGEVYVPEFDSIRPIGVVGAHPQPFGEQRRSASEYATSLDLQAPRFDANPVFGRSCGDPDRR